MIHILTLPIIMIFECPFSNDAILLCVHIGCYQIYSAYNDTPCTLQLHKAIRMFANSILHVQGWIKGRSLAKRDRLVHLYKMSVRGNTIDPGNNLLQRLIFGNHGTMVIFWLTWPSFIKVITSPLLPWIPIPPEALIQPDCVCILSSFLPNQMDLSTSRDPHVVTWSECSWRWRNGLCVL